MSRVPEHLWSDPDIHAALSAWDFGRVSVLLRTRGKLRQCDVADLTGLSQSFLSMLEAGRRRLTNIDRIRQFLYGLSAPPELVPTPTSAWDAGTEAAAGFPEPFFGSTDPTLPWTAARMVKALEVAMEGDGMDRRGILAASGIVLTAFVNHWSTAEAEPLQRVSEGSRLTRRFVDSLQDVTDQMRTIDAADGSGTLRELGDQHLQLLKHLAERSSYNEETGRQLAAVIADTAAQTGWFAFDSGDRGHTLGYLYAALRAAKASGDARLGAAALSYIAIYSYSTGLPHQAVAAAEHARQHTRRLGTPALHAMLLTRQARGHAKLGERQRAISALEQAHDLCAQGRSDNDPPWLYWISEGEIYGQAGSCYLDLGDLDGAVECFSRARAALNPDQQRTKGLFLTRAATAHIAQGDLDVGCATAHEALDLAERLQSTRLDDHVRDMLKQLPPAVGNPHIRGVRERAAETCTTERPT